MSQASRAAGSASAPAAAPAPLTLGLLDVTKARERLGYLDDGRPLLTLEDAAEFVNQRGFATLGVLERVGLPSLSSSDPERDWNVSSRAWEWKEMLPAARACAYLKWFRSQGTFISWALYPSFYSIWGPRGGAQDVYRAGLLGRTELEVLEAVEEHGPISSRELWRLLRLKLHGRRNRLVQALTLLQRRLFVTVCGGSLEGWSMHHWDLVPRAVPEGLLDRLPDPAAAQRELVARAVANLVCCRPRDVAGLFGWYPSDVLAVAEGLAAEGRVRLDVRVKQWPGSCLACGIPGRPRGVE